MRDPKNTEAYWDKWVSYLEGRVLKQWDLLRNIEPSKGYHGQYAYDLSFNYVGLFFRRYSRGDDVATLGIDFPKILDAWALAEAFGKSEWSDEAQMLRHSLRLNLDFYIHCFWLVGMALCLDVDEELWSRLVALMGNEGEDALLDSVIATRCPSRAIGKSLCFPSVYALLYEAIGAPREAQGELIRRFMLGWYPALKGAGSDYFPKALRTPSWYDYGEQNMEGGAYFGRWCVEAVAVVKAFGIDDASCVSLPMYPADLVMDGRAPRFESTESSPMDVIDAKQPRASWLKGLFRRDRGSR